MKTVQGEVTSIHEKDFHGTMLYSFRIDEKPQFWRCGKNKPDVTVKDYIEFQAQLQNVVPGSIQVVERKTHLESVADAVQKKMDEAEGEIVKEMNKARDVLNSKEIPPDVGVTRVADVGVTRVADINARIRYQQARRDATNLVVAALHTDALPWTAAQQKNKSKKLDLLTGYIEKVTETLLDQETNNA